MTQEEAQRAIRKVLERAMRLALRDGQTFIRVTYDAERDELGFNTIPREFVEVKYDTR
jgi:hypothetical protein